MRKIMLIVLLSHAIILSPACRTRLDSQTKEDNAPVAKKDIDPKEYLNRIVLILKNGVPVCNGVIEKRKRILTTEKCYFNHNNDDKMSLVRSDGTAVKVLEATRLKSELVSIKVDEIKTPLSPYTAIDPAKELTLAYLEMPNGELQKSSVALLERESKWAGGANRFIHKPISGGAPIFQEDKLVGMIANCDGVKGACSRTVYFKVFVEKNYSKSNSISFCSTDKPKERFDPAEEEECEPKDKEHVGTDAGDPEPKPSLPRPSEGEEPPPPPPDK